MVWNPSADVPLQAPRTIKSVRKARMRFFTISSDLGGGVDTAHKPWTDPSTNQFPSPNSCFGAEFCPPGGDLPRQKPGLFLKALERGTVGV